MDDLEDYFWKKPTEIHNLHEYKIIGYVTMSCLALGIITFIPGMAVLTRKHMTNPINTILIHYSINSMLAGLAYAPRTYHELFRSESCAIPKHRTYAWEVISYYSLNISAAFRHFAVWMALMTGVWRYIAVIYPLKERRVCNIETTKKVILMGYGLILFTVTIPFYFFSTVGPVIKLLDENGCPTTNFTTAKNVTIYEFKIIIDDYPLLYAFSFTYLGLAVKLVPSGLLTFISARLIKAVLDARKRRRQMTSISSNKNACSSKTERQMNRNKDRTTIMILVILGFFVLGEVPLGIFITLSGLYGPKFFWKHWYYIMEVGNVLTFISEAFNFLIYYLMSRAFRETFNSFIKRKTDSRKSLNPQTSVSSLPGVNSPKESTISRSSSVVTVSSSYT